MLHVPTAAAVALIALTAGVAAAQPEDRRYDPSATPALAERCAKIGMDHPRPGDIKMGTIDVRGATRGGTGVVTSTRDAGTPAPPGVITPSDSSYQECMRRGDR